jgi:hypothetical protein
MRCCGPLAGPRHRLDTHAGPAASRPNDTRE